MTKGVERILSRSLSTIYRSAEIKFYLFIFSFIHIFIYLYIYLFLFIYLFIYLYIHLFLFIHSFIFIYLFSFIYSFIYQFNHSFNHLFIHSFIYFSGLPLIHDAPVLMLRPRAWNMVEHNMIVSMYVDVDFSSEFSFQIRFVWNILVDNEFWSTFFLTLMLLMANLVNTKWCKKKLKKNDWNSSTWVLIWECSARAIQWIPTWHSLDGFQKSLRPCALDKSSLSNGRFFVF